MTRRLGFAVVIARRARRGRRAVARARRSDAQDLPQRLAGPSWPHPLGLDELGRDVLARLLLGARISLLVGVAVVSLSAIVGVAVGAVAGYVGGWVDERGWAA